MRYIQSYVYHSIIHNGQDMETTQKSIHRWMDIKDVVYIHVHECLCTKLLWSCTTGLLFVNLWTVVPQAPLSMGFSRQEYWIGLSCSSPGDLPNLGIKPGSLMSPALAGRFLPLPLLEKPIHDGILFSHDKGGYHTIFNDMDRLWAYYIKSYKSEKDKYSRMSVTCEI